MSPCTKYRGPAGSLIISRPLEILKIDFSVVEKDRSTNVFTKFSTATAIRGEKISVNCCKNYGGKLVGIYWHACEFSQMRERHSSSH